MIGPISVSILNTGQGINRRLMKQKVPEKLPHTEKRPASFQGKEKMAKSPRIKICNLIFVMKALLAIILGIAGLGIQGYFVYDNYEIGSKLKANELKPLVIDPKSPECQAIVGKARMEPLNKLMFGFHIDWQQTTPKKFRDLIGFTPAVVNAFLRMDPTTSPIIDFANFDWHGQEVRNIGGILSLTIEPIAMAQITDAMINELADRCLMVNEKYGVPMMLRFGHEMNG